MKRLPSYALLLALLAAPAWAGGHYTPVAGGSFHSALRLDGSARETIQVQPFRMRTEPVSRREFLAFVTRVPQWRRTRTATLFAADGYLSDWQGLLVPGAGQDASRTAVSCSIVLVIWAWTRSRGSRASGLPAPSSESCRMRRCR